MKQIIVISTFILISSFSRAQNSIVYPLMAEIGTGTSLYHGDICPDLSCISPGANLTAGLRYLVNKNISFNPQIGWYRVSGDDAKGPNTDRNLSFRSDNVNLAMRLEYNFNSYSMRQENRPKVNPFIVVGGGGLFFNPKANYENTWYELQPLTTAGSNYSRFSLFAGLGLGFRIKVDKRTSVIFEYNYDFLFTDYLDDVANENYFDNKDLLGIAAVLADRSGEIGLTPTETSDGVHWSEGTLRGSTPLPDQVSHLAIKIEWYMEAVQVICPEF